MGERKYCRYKRYRYRGMHRTAMIAIVVMKGTRENIQKGEVRNGNLKSAK